MDIIYRRHTYNLELTEEQKYDFWRISRTSDWIFNQCLSVLLMNCHLTYFEMCTNWKHLKKMRPWLSHVDSNVARAAMQDAERAMQPYKQLVFAALRDEHKKELTKQIRTENPDINDMDLKKELDRRVNEMLPMEIYSDAHKRKKDRKYKKRPNWRERDDLNAGLRFAEASKSVKFTERTYVDESGDKQVCKRMSNFHVPKQGLVKVRDSWKSAVPHDTEIAEFGMVMKNGKWKMNVCHKLEGYEIGLSEDEEELLGMTILSIDLGVTNTVTTHDGRHFKLPKMKNLHKRLEKNQQKLSRMKKGSNNYRRQRLKVARLHEEIASKRRNWLHQLTSELAKEADIVVAEDLKIKNMTRSAKGTIEEPGSNVSQKRGLNRSILLQGWGMGLSMFKYKSQFVRIDPKNTSTICYECGHKDKDNRKGVRFKCMNCGHKDHADVNAAKNIGLRGADALGMGLGSDFRLIARNGGNRGGRMADAVTDVCTE